jgi:plastocyanin
MVFAVNPPSTEDFNDFKARAMAVATARGAAATGAGSDANPDANPDGACPPDSGTGVDYEVIVGGTDGLSFQPDTITADVGDRVIFVFSGTGIHSVTESSFDTPCGISGFDSGR